MLCFFEDTLENFRNLEQPEGAVATKNIVKLVVAAILKARGECTSIRQEMNDLEIDPWVSALGELIDSCASDLGLADANSAPSVTEEKDVASLVSAVVGASEGTERTAAIDALKAYRISHGDEELKTHLQDVSPVFRSYLMKELSESPQSLSPKTTSNNAMSERIKNLRSKLNSTEGALTHTVPELTPPLKTIDQQQRMKELRMKLNATQAAVSYAASTFPVPSATESEEQHMRMDSGDSYGQDSVTSVDKVSDDAKGSNPTISAFRERLAAAKEKQAAVKTSSGDFSSPMPTSSASSRAAALRARLQAVKRQNKLE